MAKERKKGPTPPMPRPKQLAISIEAKELLAHFPVPSNAPLIKAIEDHLGTPVLALVMGEDHWLEGNMVEPFYGVLESIGKVDSLSLFLISQGGVTEVPWRIISLLREFCTRLRVIVPVHAVSGATHIAIAADELIMGDRSFLGSVDPTRRHPLLPKDDKGKPIPVSVQDLKHCIQFIRDQLGESYPQQNLALIITELFKHINPLSIGAIEQSYSLSKLITDKALRTRREPLDDEHISIIVKKLSEEYYSHSFPISRDDVEKDLKLKVTRPDKALWDRINQLRLYYEPILAAAKQLKAGPAEFEIRYAGFIDSTAERRFLCQVKPLGQPVAQKRWLDVPKREERR